MAARMGKYTVGVLLTVIVALGSCYEIITSAVLVESLPGADKEATFDCTVEGSDYDFFQHVIEWQKKQLREDKIGVTVAVFQNRRGIFSNERISVDKTDRTTPTQRLSLTLTIKNLRHEDSGWYRCLIQDDGAIVKSVEHRLYVYAPVQSLIMFGYPKTADILPNMTAVEETHQSMSFRETEMGYIECRSYGGFPQPVLRMLIGDTQITSAIPDISPDVPELEGDDVGMQSIMYTGLRVSRNYHPPANYDGKTIRCRAEVSVNQEQQQSMETSSRLNIQGSPLFHNCTKEVKAQVGQENVMLYCEFVSKPQWDAVTWMGITHQETINGASLEPVVQNGYQAYTKQLAGYNMYQATLVIPLVRQQHFQSYKLKVVNEIDSEETILKLIQGTPDRDNGETGGASTFNAAIWCSFIMFISSLLLTRWSC